MWRVWAPRLGGETLWARLRRRTRIGRSLARGAGEAGDPGCLVDIASDAFWIFVIVIVVTVLVLVGLPLVLALVDVLVLAVLTLLGLAARVVFRRPWVVEARSTAALPPEGTDAWPSDAPGPGRAPSHVARGRLAGERRAGERRGERPRARQPAAAEAHGRRRPARRPAPRSVVTPPDAA